MMNILSAELYRFSRQKSTWVLIILSLVLTLLSACMVGFVAGNAPWLSGVYQHLSDILSQGVSGDNASITEIFRLMSFLKLNSISDFIVACITADFIMVVIGFVFLFCTAAHSTGYIKNLYPLEDRSSFFFSNALILLFFAFIIYFGSALIALFVSFIFFENTAMGNLFSVAFFLLLNVLLCWALGLLIIPFFQLFKRSGTAVIVTFLYFFLGSSILYSIIDMIFTGFAPNFTIQYCTLIGSLNLLTFDDYKTYLGAMINILVYTGIAFYINLVLMRHKDVN